ncbi:MAG: sensor histidine kinase [Trueperaceae bacterium]
MARADERIDVLAIAALVAWLAVGAPLLLGALGGAVGAGLATATAIVAWAVFGGLYAAVATWRLAHLSYRAHRLVLALLTVLAAVVLGARPDQGTSAILFVLTAVHAAHVLPAAAGAAWLALQTAAVAAAQATAGADVLLPTGRYAAIMAFAYLTTRGGVRERAAREALERRNAELRATRALLAEHERVAERVRIARELHDLIGHHLTALVLNLDVAGRSEGAAVRPPLVRAEGLARNLLDDVRDAVHALRAEDGLDVASAVRALVEGVPEPEVEAVVPDRLHVADPRAAHVLLRCAQELLTNALRHADARRVRIALEPRADGVALEVRDDGRGATAAELAAATRRGGASGSGLAGLRARLEAVGGHLEVVGAPRRGLVATAFVPTEGRREPTA